jgi:membrane-associated phospholipid phosphatase
LPEGLFPQPAPVAALSGHRADDRPAEYPSFPAGHAVQAYLISYLLAYSLPKLPQQYAPEDNLEGASGVLFDLAERVSVNRIVAGLHYPTDIVAGRALGRACFKALTRVNALWSLENLTGKLDDFGQAFPGARDGKSLRALVQEEFPQYA